MSAFFLLSAVCVVLEDQCPREMANFVLKLTLFMCLSFFSVQRQERPLRIHFQLAIEETTAQAIRINLPSECVCLCVCAYTLYILNGYCMAVKSGTVLLLSTYCVTPQRLYVYLCVCANA